MLLIYIVGISCVLLGGFIILTAFERRHGRLFGATRKRLDRWVGRVTYIARHVDWSAFIKDIVHSTVERVVHDIAHASLKLVRFIERLLTRLVRSLRERRSGFVRQAEGAPQGKRWLARARSFVRLHILHRKNKDDTMGGS